MAAKRSARRGRQQHLEGEAQGDGRQWPGYRAQLALQAHVPAAERRAAAERAQVLREQGWGALQAWLEAPGPHPGERSAPAKRPARDGLADLFDAA